MPLNKSFIVNIRVKKTNGSFSEGTGIVVNKSQGLILTCEHVINQHKEIKVIVCDKEGIYNSVNSINFYAKVYQNCEHQLEDIALLQIKKPTVFPDYIDAAKLVDEANSDQTPYKSIGFSYKSVNGILLQGYISDICHKDEQRITRLLLCDSNAVNSGASGAPIYDLKQEAVVGIIKMKGPSGTGLAMGIPTSVIQSKLNRYIQVQNSKNFKKLPNTYLSKGNLYDSTRAEEVHLFSLKQDIFEIDELLSFINYNISFDYDKPSHYLKMRENLKKLNIIQTYNKLYKRGFKENIDLFEIGKSVSNYLKLIGNKETAQDIYTKNLDIAKVAFADNQTRQKKEEWKLIHQGWGFYGKPEAEVEFCRSEFGEKDLNTLVSLRCLSCKLMIKNRFKEAEEILDSIEQDLDLYKNNENYPRHRAYLHFQRGKLQYFIASKDKNKKKLDRTFFELENALTFFKKVNKNHTTINYVYYFLFKSFVLLGDYEMAGKYHELIKLFFSHFPEIHLCHTDIIDIKIALKLKQ